VDRLFSGDELHELMCGVADLDPQGLSDALWFDERCGRTLIPQWVKALVHARDMTWRKKLLRFITGSFSLPRGGLQRKIAVRLQGGGFTHHLPRASTCTFTLFMPPYGSKEELERKLTLAIDHGAGFWLW
jgi:hypothetical protein